MERVLLEGYNWSEARFTLDWIRTDERARRYLEGFPADGDVGVVALIDSTPVGAVWGRSLPAERAGYGFVASDVPELTLGVLPAARRRGVALRLMTTVVDIARQRRIAGLSLSVEDGNTARRLYERFGFAVVGRNGGSDTMLLDTGDGPFIAAAGTAQESRSVPGGSRSDRAPMPGQSTPPRTAARESRWTGSSRTAHTGMAERG